MIVLPLAAASLLNGIGVAPTFAGGPLPPRHGSLDEPLPLVKCSLRTGNHPLNGLMALYADNVVNAQPHVPQPIKGKKATEEDLGNFLKAFPDARMESPVVVVKGDTIAMEWAFTGTHKGALVGPMGSIPPTNKKVHIKGAEFTRHNAQGLIVDERGYFDLANFMTQLGVMHSPGGA